MSDTGRRRALPLPQTRWDSETVAAVIRVNSGNFRLLNRLLTQITRILELNTLEEVARAAGKTAQEKLVIGLVKSQEPPFRRSGALQKTVASLKALAIPLRSADRIRSGLLQMIRTLRRT